MEKQGITKEILVINWNFIENNNDNNDESNKSSCNNSSYKKSYNIREARTMIMENLNPNDKRSMLALAHGDPSAFSCFRTCRNAEDAVVEALRSGNFNSYADSNGLLSARKAVAEYLSRDLPYMVSANSVYMTNGCTEAIEITLSALARPRANILLPKPGYPCYEIRSEYIGLETRHFDLLPENGWEVDLQSLEAQADSNTVAMVLINPGNPCGNVLTYKHLQKVAEVARRLGIMIISDEVYGELTFGSNPFVPMAMFASTVPVITLGSLSKRWNVPGWRLGWLVTHDPHGILLNSGVIKRVEYVVSKSSDPVTFLQAALPKIIKGTSESFFTKITNILQQDAHICYETLKEIPALTCSYKPDGSMFMMVKLNVSLLEDIEDDVDFCIKLASEENTIVLPGVTVGLRNWLRVTFALDPTALEEGLERMKSFCQRHSKTQ